MLRAAENPDLLACMDSSSPAGIPLLAQAPGGSRNWVAFFRYARRPRTPLEGVLTAFRILGFFLGLALFLMAVLYISIPATFGSDRSEPIAALIVGPISMTVFFLGAYLCAGYLVEPSGKPAFIAELVFQIFNLIVNACALAWLSLFDFGRYHGHPDWWVFVVLFSLDGGLALIMAVTMSVLIAISNPDEEKELDTEGFPGQQFPRATT